MKLVIDIPESIIEHIKDGSFGARPYDRFTLITAALNGTPLPKGHGALKDVDKIGLTNFECFLCNGDYKEALKMLIDKIKNADTIVEADDKEAEE